MTTLSIVPKPRFDAAVLLSIPGTDKSAKLTFTFKHKSRRELRVWVERIADARKSDDGTDTDILLEVIEGWPDGPRSADGSRIEFSAAALAELLEVYPASSYEIFQAYMTQLAWARAKN